MCCVVENLEGMAESSYSSTGHGTMVIIRSTHCVLSLLDVVVCVIVCVRTYAMG